jgi:hypothetical protein
MLRVILLSLALIISLGALLPLATNYSEAGPRKQKQSKKREWKGIKKYSKRWWQLYRAQERRKRAIAARRGKLQSRQEMHARQRQENGAEAAQTAAKTADRAGRPISTIAVKENSARAVLPSGESAPQSWKRTQETTGELQFRVDDDGGKQIGSASLSVVGPAVGADAPNGTRNKTLGGVSTSALRRTVIDRMMKEDGWVVNDYQKDVGGRKVFVVVAQSRNKNGQVEARTFYFTEVEGKIYSLATNTPNESSERLAQESERVINSLNRGNRPTQAELR